MPARSRAADARHSMLPPTNDISRVAPHSESGHTLRDIWDIISTSEPAPKALINVGCCA